MKCDRALYMIILIQMILKSSFNHLTKFKQIMPDNTDEDKMIERLIIHKNMIGWLITKLQSEGIECKRTTANDPNGDILLINSDDVPRVKQIVRQIQQDYTQ